MGPVRIPAHPQVLVGSSTADDAGVVRLTDELALVQTVDFFPPMVDDPYDFGRVGAANSLSDVYAMGGEPVSAVCVYALPSNVPEHVPAAILQGAVDTLELAGCPLIGGHTVKDVEIKFGLCVNGIVHPERIATNAGARAGDVLVLTKPLGSGYLCTALKRETLDEGEIRALVEVMATLNKAAAEAMMAVGVNAATDITGFGLLGHAHGIAAASGVTLRIVAADVPLMAGLERHITPENTCGGLKRNADYAAQKVRFSGGSEVQRGALADPQTSGGLLISVPRGRLDALLGELKKRNVATRAVIGDVVARSSHFLEIR